LQYIYEITPPASKPKTEPWTITRKLMKAGARVLRSYPNTGYVYARNGMAKQLRYNSKAKCLVWPNGSGHYGETPKMYAYTPEGL
jgi:hypothetical protein